MRKTLCLLVFVCAAVLVGAQTKSFYGTWKVNSAKSDLKGVTATYKDLGGGRVEISGMGQKDTFVIGRDGKDYPWVGGMTTTWTDRAPDRYDTVMKRDGQVLAVFENTLSSDGKTVTSVVKSTPPAGGKPTQSTNTFLRVAGGPGVFGTWRMLELEGRLHIEPAGAGVLFRWVDIAEAKCQFDGKDCRLEGAVPAESTITLRETGARSFEYQDKTQGKVNYTSRFTVSADGKTLTEEETMATGEKLTFLYERQ